MCLFPATALAKQKLIICVTNYWRMPDIQNVSFSFASPSADGNWNSDFKYDHAVKTTDFSANLKWADPDYFKTYQS